MCPQQEQEVLVPGKNRSALINSLPYHPDLYSGWRTSSPQEAPEMERLYLLDLNIPLMQRSSTAPP